MLFRSQSDTEYLRNNYYQSAIMDCALSVGLNGKSQHMFTSIKPTSKRNTLIKFISAIFVRLEDKLYFSLVDQSAEFQNLLQTGLEVG